MTGMLWRLLIAIVVVLFAFVIIPPALRIFGLPLTGDVEVVVRAAIGLLALLYVIAGPPPSWWKPAA